MFNKKSSLSLSINAIVVLILAITMLGLGLGFIRTMFGKVTNIAEEQLAAEPEPPIPTSTDAVTLSRYNIIGNTGEAKFMKVAVYCAQTNCPAPLATIACTGTNPVTPTNPIFTVLTSGQTQTSVAKLVLNTVGSNVCSITITNLQSGNVKRDFTVIIK